MRLQSAPFTVKSVTRDGKEHEASNVIGGYTLETESFDLELSQLGLMELPLHVTLVTPDVDTAFDLVHVERRDGDVLFGSYSSVGTGDTVVHLTLFND